MLELLFDDNANEEILEGIRVMQSILHFSTKPNSSPVFFPHSYHFSMSYHFIR